MKVTVNFDPLEIEKIDEACGGRSEVRGRQGGRALWLRKLVRSHFSMSEPLDVHEQQAKSLKGKPGGNRPRCRACGSVTNLKKCSNPKCKTNKKPTQKTQGE